MSIQIQIAQSKTDEQALVEFMHRRGDFQFHARMFKTRCLQPASTLLADDQQVQCFRIQNTESVRSHLKRVVGADNSEQILPSNGLSIEWSRTEWIDAATCIPGRLYLDNRSPVSNAVTVELSKDIRAIVRFIRRTYPRKSSGRRPYYVGPNLSRMIADGSVRLVYRPGGKDISLQDALPDT